MLALLVLSLLAASLRGINAVLKNLTVDDTDTRTITYLGAWESYNSGLDFGGSHRLSSDAAANATFEFVGTAVYYVSPRWPYMVTSRISIDGGAAVSVNLTDPNASPTPIGGSESAMYSVVWSATNLANKSHKILVTYENYIVVDGFLCVFIHISSRKEGGRFGSYCAGIQWTMELRPQVHPLLQAPPHPHRPRPHRPGRLPPVQRRLLTGPPQLLPPTRD
ncbi:hypothetical protein DFH08DRAFT_880997 [Mycena albidolilacea]|uniref:Uncharacterized protein n=1 Tax=Mycena albidolilacea TaxID=1033008 RepID=A0AAD6ZPL2_9AGAR|nr:hypothetical protein DFH08DRAFT_880997 [Mycena albidolilacea]